MLKARNVESFNLDHNKVLAPYVRLSGRLSGPKGDEVSKFDIRFTQPNKEYLSTAAIHTLEHLAAEYLRDELPTVIDLSPMGCRTGFYLTVFGSPAEAEIAEKLLVVMDKIALWKDDDPVPGVHPVMCGNWEDHNLGEAREWAARWAKGIRKKGWEAFPPEL